MKKLVHIGIFLCITTSLHAIPEWLKCSSKEATDSRQPSPQKRNLTLEQENKKLREQNRILHGEVAVLSWHLNAQGQENKKKEDKLEKTKKELKEAKVAAVFATNQYDALLEKYKKKSAYKPSSRKPINIPEKPLTTEYEFRQEWHEEGNTGKPMPIRVELIRERRITDDLPNIE